MRKQSYKEAGAVLDHCPRCEEALKTGFLRSGQRSILWTPFDEKVRFTCLPAWEGEFSLPGANLWRGAKCPARYCENCGLILIETKKEEST